MPDVPERVLGSIVRQLRDMAFVEWKPALGGECVGAVRITAAGIYWIESHSAPIPPEEISRPQMTVHPIHKLMTWFAFIAGVLFALLGVVLVWLGATGSTKIALWGADISTGSVGVASIALGAVLIGSTFRRILKSVETLQA
jgi:hypothetical protein